MEVLSPLSFLNSISVVNFPTGGIRKSWKSVKNEMQKYVSSVAIDKEYPDLFDDYGLRVTDNIVDRVADGLSQLPDDVFRDLLIEGDLTDRMCFKPGNRKGRKRAPADRAKPELVNHFCLRSGYKQQIETMLQMDDFSGTFIDKNALRRFLDGGSEYLPGIQGTVFHALLLCTGVIITIPAPGHKIGYKGWKTSSANLFRFVREVLPDRVDLLGIPETLSRMRQEMNSVIDTRQRTSGFTQSQREEIARRANFTDQMTGRIEYNSPEYHNRHANYMYVCADIAKAHQRFMADHVFFGKGECDHIIPRSKGGKDTIENGQYLSKETHKNKGDRAPHGETTTLIGFYQLLDFRMAEQLVLNPSTEVSVERLSSIIDKAKKMCYFPHEYKRMSSENIALDAVKNYDFPIFNRDKQLYPKSCLRL